jgi:hypothetical protein
MAQPIEIREQSLPHSDAGNEKSALGRLGARIKLVVTRSIFWSYQRGSWQYDVIVIVILAFIFLSPRSWFKDRPTLQLTDLRHQQGIMEMSRVKKDVQYLVDARLVDSLGQKPEDAVPIILRQHLQKAFTIKSIDAVRDRHQVVLGYTVMVEE